MTGFPFYIYNLIPKNNYLYNSINHGCLVNQPCSILLFFARIIIHEPILRAV